MYRVTKREKKIVWLVSAIIGVSFLVSILYVTFIIGVRLPLKSDALLILGLAIAIFPPAIVNLLDTRWRTAIDNNIPRLLREIAEAGRSGITLTRAIELSAERRYGPLSKELKRMGAQLTWGVTLEEAIRSFMERVDTRLARRTFLLILEASRGGGDIQEVIESLNRHVSDLQVIERERRGAIRPYVTIIYTAFGVFLFTNVLLLKTFFMELAKLQKEVAGQLFALGALDIATIQDIFYDMANVQAVFGGLAAGKMAEGAMGAGLKHTLILIAASFLVFYFFVWR